MDPTVSVLARLFGAAVFVLGLACLKTRHDVRNPVGLAVSLGITGYSVLAAVVLFWTVADSGRGGPVAVGCRLTMPCSTSWLPPWHPMPPGHRRMLARLGSACGETTPKTHRTGT